MNIEILPMTQNDLEILIPNLASEFDDFWTPSVLISEFESFNSHLLVAKNEGSIVGFGGIKVILGEAEIMNLVTSKEYRKKRDWSYVIRRTYLSISYSFLQSNSFRGKRIE